MTRRRLLLFAAAAACLLLAGPFGVRWATTPKPGVTLANFKRLHTGMTLEEINEVMGRPPDMAHRGSCSWEVDDGSRARVVMSFYYHPAPQGWFSTMDGDLEMARTPPSLFDKMRRWLGL